MSMKPTSDRPHPGAEAAAPAAATARPKKVYRRPGIVRWGNLLEMTQATGTQGNRDGGRRPYQRTR